jgi:hypothetical protein
LKTWIIAITGALTCAVGTGLLVRRPTNRVYRSVPPTFAVQAVAPPEQSPREERDAPSLVADWPEEPGQTWYMCLDGDAADLVLVLEYFIKGLDDTLRYESAMRQSRSDEPLPSSSVAALASFGHKLDGDGAGHQYYFAETPDPGVTVDISLNWRLDGTRGVVNAAVTAPVGRESEYRLSDDVTLRVSYRAPGAKPRPPAGG